MKILLVVIFLFVILSCSKSNAEQAIYDNIRTYQYHEKDIKDFSFLSKYKNLELIDLSETLVNDLSFTKKLPKLKKIILENVTDDYKKIKYFMNIIKLNKIKIYGVNNFDFSINSSIDNYFSILYDKKTKKIDLIEIEQNSYLSKPAIFYNLSGILQLKSLKKLKIILRNDRYIDYLIKLKFLEELYLMGNFEELPQFQKSLKKLYLYNIPIKDFSFLKKSNIEYLYIVTKKYKDEKWIKLKKEYPNIHIEIKNMLFTPIKECSYHFKNKKKANISFDGFYLNTTNCNVVKDLRNNILDFEFSPENISSLNMLGISINNLWKGNITFLDKAIEQERNEIAKYLLYSYQKFVTKTGKLYPKIKKGCEILNTKCKNFNDTLEYKDLEEYKIK